MSVQTIKEVDELKKVIGWSWLEIAARFHWGPPTIAKFRANKMEMNAGQLAYLRAVAAAVSAVPLPDIMGGEMNPKEERVLRAAGFAPPEEAQIAPREPVPLNVIPLDDVARIIAQQYSDLTDGTSPEAREMNQDERAGAIWALGKIAESLALSQLVRQHRAAMASPPPAPPPAPRPVVNTGFGRHPFPAAEVGPDVASA